jgi:DNA-binding HxlR family transcriptional regulator
MEDEKQVENDRQHAEVFDALGHPTRIAILKALSEGSLGFADLKKKTAIESSGHLQHHLSKLNGLIRTDDYGKYCLSDQGKDALLTVQTVENASPKNNSEENVHSTLRRHFNNKIGSKPLSILLVALLLASLAIALYAYNQTVILHSENTFLNGANPEVAAYYNQFGDKAPITFTNSSVKPPISMYQALLTGLEADDWNKTSLQGFIIYCSLVPWETTANHTGTVAEGAPPFNDSQVAEILTSPPANYSDIYFNGTVYSYVWHIDIMNSKYTLGDIKPWDVIVVDASTGQLLSHWVR